MMKNNKFKNKVSYKEMMKNHSLDNYDESKKEKGEANNGTRNIN